MFIAVAQLSPIKNVWPLVFPSAKVTSLNAKLTESQSGQENLFVNVSWEEHKAARFARRPRYQFYRQHNNNCKSHSDQRRKSTCEFDKLHSWHEASTFCQKEANGDLPQFVDRREQDDFLETLHHYRRPVEALFIGLVRKSGKVNSYRSKNYLCVLSLPGRFILLCFFCLQFTWKTSQAICTFQSWDNTNFGANTSLVLWKPGKPECTYDCHDAKYFYTIYNEKLTAQMKTTNTVLQPRRGINKTFEAFLCAMLFTAHLAAPKWILVDCSMKLLADIVCDPGNKQIQASISSNHSYTSFYFCNSGQTISKANKCLLFLPIRKISKASHLRWRCKNHNMTLQMCPTRSGIWTDISGMLRATKESFPPLITCGNGESHLVSLTSRYIWQQLTLNTDLKQQRTDNSLSLCESTAHSNNRDFSSLLAFQCPNGEFISTIFRCNGKVDCKVSSNTYESDDDEANCSCDHLFHGRSGKCVSYKQTARKVVVPVSLFVCLSGLSVSLHQVNDLIPDCEEAEAEPLLKNLRSHPRETLCNSPGQISCLEGHPACFNISEICVLKLNSLGHLIPCRTGSHIEDCRNHR